uniref:Uncharacterized protein n=1 Tax=Megaselia scalaris TaxID=36166 RepID=T1GAS4_MEGSC
MSPTNFTIKAGKFLNIDTVQFLTSNKTNQTKQNVQTYLSHLRCYRLCRRQTRNCSSFSLLIPSHCSPRSSYATSSQFVARTHNGIVAPVAAKIVAPAPLAYTAPIVRAAYTFPVVASAPIIKAAAPLAYTAPVAYSSPLVHSHLASPLTYSAPLLF